MACREEELVLLANGRLGRWARWRCERHLRACPTCRARLAELTALGAALRETVAVRPSEALDHRVLSQRYEAVPHLAPALIPLGRFTPPLVGLMLGLAYGLSTNVPQPNYYQVNATADLVVRKAPPQAEWGDGLALMRVLELRHHKASGYASIDPFGGTIRLSFTPYRDNPEQEKLATQGLKNWEDALVASPELKRLGWNLQGVKNQRQSRIPLNSTRNPMEVFWWSVLGFGLGCLFVGLRFLGGWLPGGLPVALGLGVIVGLGGGVLLLHNQLTDRFQATLQFTKVAGSMSSDDLYECQTFVNECQNFVGRRQLPSPFFASGARPHLPDRVEFTVAAFKRTRATTPATVTEAAVAAQSLVESKALPLLGYSVSVVEPMAPEPLFVRLKQTVLPCLGLGFLAGLIMGLFRRR